MRPKLEILENASRNLDKALMLLNEVRKECRAGVKSSTCAMLENIVLSILDARIRLSILKNRVRSGRERIRVVSE